MTTETKTPPAFDEDSIGLMTDAFAKLICEILVTSCINDLDPIAIHDAAWEQFVAYSEEVLAEEPEPEPA